MNSELLYITRKLGYPSSFGTRAGLGIFLDQYPDGIYAETGTGAPMGWESAAVWFGGDSERVSAKFERMMSQRNELSRLFRTRIAGVLVLTFIYRLKSRMVTAIPIIGGHPQPIDPTWLYFTMPEGGTVSLSKNGTPTEVTLEYSLDNGNTWTEWVETGNVRSLTLAAGQTMHIRNTSETSTGFSTGNTSYYYFTFTADTYTGGNVNSLLCKTPQNALLTNFCYYYMFRNTQQTLTMSDTFVLPSTTLAPRCYSYMFNGCLNLIISNTFALPATKLTNLCYARMFYGCKNVNLIRTYMTDISATECIANWLLDVSDTGDFYCPAELTIPTGVNGIPSGWTRHNI